MLLLAFVWLGLVVLELVRGPTPVLETVTTVVWVIFILEFSLRLWLAPMKRAFLRAGTG